MYVLSKQTDKAGSTFPHKTNRALENAGPKSLSPFRFLMRSNISFVPDSKEM
jgi:hypothetical protein